MSKEPIKVWDRQRLKSRVRAFVVCFLVMLLPLGIWQATGDLRTACITTTMNAVMLALGFYFKSTGDKSS